MSSKEKVVELVCFIVAGYCHCDPEHQYECGLHKPLKELARLAFAQAGSEARLGPDNAPQLASASEQVDRTQREWWIRESLSGGETCPDCGSILMPVEGCWKCRCGYSRC